MTRRLLTMALALGLAWGAASIASVANAQPGGSSDERARTHFEAGRAHYDAGRFREALAEFRAAYELSPRPLLLYNIYLAALDLGEIRPAADALRRYLRSGDVEPAERPQLEAQQRALDERIAREDAERAGGTGDGQGAAGDGGDGEADGGSGAEAGDGAGGGSGAAPEDRSSGGVPILSWVSWGVAGAAAITATVTGIMALGHRSTLDDHCTDGPGGNPVCPPEYEDDRDSGQTLALVTDISIGVAVVGAAVGAVFLLTSGGDDDADRASARGGGRGRGRPDRGAAATVTPTFGPGRAGLSAQLRF